MIQWICHPEDHKGNHLVPVFRRRFELRQKSQKAVLRLLAHGVTGYLIAMLQAVYGM